MRPTANHTASLTVRAGIGGEPVVQKMEPSAAMAFRSAPWGIWLVGSVAHPVGETTCTSR